MPISRFRSPAPSRPHPNKQKQETAATQRTVEPGEDGSGSGRPGLGRVGGQQREGDSDVTTCAGLLDRCVCACEQPLCDGWRRKGVGGSWGSSWVWGHLVGSVGGYVDLESSRIDGIGRSACLLSGFCIASRHLTKPPSHIHTARSSPSSSPGPATAAARRSSGSGRSTRPSLSSPPAQPQQPRQEQQQPPLRLAPRACSRPLRSSCCRTSGGRRTGQCG